MSTLLAMSTKTNVSNYEQQSCSLRLINSNEQFSIAHYLWANNNKK